LERAWFYWSLILTCKNLKNYEGDIFVHWRSQIITCDRFRYLVRYTWNKHTKKHWWVIFFWRVSYEKIIKQCCLSKALLAMHFAKDDTGHMQAAKTGILMTGIGMTGSCTTGSMSSASRNRIWCKKITISRNMFELVRITWKHVFVFTTTSSNSTLLILHHFYSFWVFFTAQSSVSWGLFGGCRLGANWNKKILILIGQ